MLLRRLCLSEGVFSFLDWGVVHIDVPFYKAGLFYGWNDRFRQIGIGVKVRYVQGGGRLRVRVGRSDVVYSIDRFAARAIVRKYNSIYEGRGFNLVVLPWSAFEKEEVLRPVVGSLCVR